MGALAVISILGLSVIGFIYSARGKMQKRALQVGKSVGKTKVPVLTPIILGVICTLATILGVTIGYRLISAAAHAKSESKVLPLAVGLALFTLTAAAWFLALTLGIVSLSHAGFAILAVLALFTFGVFGSKPKGYTREYAGIACVLLAMFLMVTVA